MDNSINDIVNEVMTELRDNAQCTLTEDYVETMQAVTQAVIEYALIKVQDEKKMKAMLRSIQLFHLLILQALHNEDAVLNAFEDLIIKIEGCQGDQNSNN